MPARIEQDGRNTARAVKYLVEPFAPISCGAQLKQYTCKIEDEVGSPFGGWPGSLPRVAPLSGCLFSLWPYFSRLSPTPTRLVFIYFLLRLGGCYEGLTKEMLRHDGYRAIRLESTGIAEACGAPLPGSACWPGATVENSAS